jgi:alpha-amylase
MQKNLILSLIILVFAGCSQPPKQEETISLPEGSVAPEWTRSASIYEVNIRQYTPEGTINAFSEHLPEIKELGTDILWLMPIYPIGVEQRKGSLGSPYSVFDYQAVNPDLGTMEDLKEMVNKAHSMGMYVILDWVANHTAWDNPLTKSNPEWYYKDETGNFKPPVADWSDVIQLNYENEGLRAYMIASLKFWINNADVDGFRCDVAGMVPTDFWEEARTELDEVKPVFMLAEAEQADHLDYAFDMNYGWELHHIMNKIAQGEMNVNNLTEYLKKYHSQYGADAYRMNFITNHDENSWNGTINERMGEAQKAMAGLMATLPGMPLIYSGQEAGLDKRLKFFEKDTIDWKESAYRPFYSTLLQLKKKNQALWNGEAGGEIKILNSSMGKSIFAFSREKDGDKIIAVFNLSKETTTFSFSPPVKTDGLSDLFGNGGVEKLSATTISLRPWEYIILTSE